MRYRIELSFNSIMGVQVWEVHDTETGDAQENLHA
jgi:hypothetical protein